MYGHFSVVSRFPCGTLLPRVSGTSRHRFGFAACAVSSTYLLTAMCARVWHGLFLVSPCSGASLLLELIMDGMIRLDYFHAEPLAHLCVEGRKNILVSLVLGYIVS